MKKKSDYIAPSVEASCVEVAGGFCINASHEGTKEEDWDELLLLTLGSGVSTHKDALE